MVAATLLHELTEAKTVDELIKISPWAWYSSELKVFDPNFEFRKSGMAGMRTKELFKIELGEKKVAANFDKLRKGKSIDLKIMKNDVLVFRYILQPIRRMLLEFACLDKKIQPEWFKFLMFLCENPGEHKLNRVAAGTGSKSFRHSIMEGQYPKFFNSAVTYVQGYRHRLMAATYEIHPEFYTKVYKPMGGWISEEGISAFKMWKAKYQARKIKWN